MPRNRFPRRRLLAERRIADKFQMLHELRSDQRDRAKGERGEIDYYSGSEAEGGLEDRLRVSGTPSHWKIEESSEKTHQKTRNCIPSNAERNRPIVGPCVHRFAGSSSWGYGGIPVKGWGRFRRENRRSWSAGQTGRWRCGRG
jgi:hypothetical protein